MTSISLHCTFSPSTCILPQVGYTLSQTECPSLTSVVHHYFLRHCPKSYFSNYPLDFSSVEYMLYGGFSPSLTEKRIQQLKQLYPSKTADLIEKEYSDPRPAYCSLSPLKPIHEEEMQWALDCLMRTLYALFSDLAAQKNLSDTDIEFNISGVFSALCAKSVTFNDGTNITITLNDASTLDFDSMRAYCAEKLKNNPLQMLETLKKVLKYSSLFSNHPQLKKVFYQQAKTVILSSHPEFRFTKISPKNQSVYNIGLTLLRNRVPFFIAAIYFLWLRQWFWRRINQNRP